MRTTSAPISSENTSTPALPQVPAMPATVATSLRLNKSEAIVMTVTESVWCAKPARLRSATATYGLSTVPTNATPVMRSAGGEPFGGGLHPGRIRRSFSEPEQGAQAEERLPVAGKAVRHADEGPRDGEDGKPDLQPEAVHHIAAEGAAA